jgi:hypothetical protein
MFQALCGVWGIRLLHSGKRPVTCSGVQEVVSVGTNDKDLVAMNVFLLVGVRESFYRPKTF